MCQLLSPYTKVETVQIALCMNLSINACSQVLFSPLLPKRHTVTQTCFFNVAPPEDHISQQSSLVLLTTKLLLVTTVLCIFFPGFSSFLSASLCIVEDVTVGLHDVLLLFKIHLEHTLDQHKGYATL